MSIFYLIVVLLMPNGEEQHKIEASFFDARDCLELSQKVNAEGYKAYCKREKLADLGVSQSAHF